MEGGGNRPEYGGRILGENKASKNCPPGRMNRGFLDQQFLIFHFKLLLTFHYAMISFCYKSLLYTPASISGALWGVKKVGVVFPTRGESYQNTGNYREVGFRVNPPEQPIHFPTSLLQTHTQKLKTNISHENI